MTAQLIDTHTHLDHAMFDADRHEVVQRAHTAGVTALITIGAGSGRDSAESSIRLAEQYPFVWATVGIHPHDAGIALDYEWLVKLARHPRVVAIGETGLDFFKDLAPRDLQQEWFELQIKLALEVSKPLVIHSRAAGKECLATLDKYPVSKIGGVFHCFAEDGAFAAELLKRNFLVSFPGTVTFKKAENVRSVVSSVPLEQIMTETDAPYMAPEPHRGKRCESAFMVETAKMIAHTKGISFEELAAQSVSNAERLFKIKVS